ncbi:PREDICTED: cell division cycle-associated protein 2 [Elephantulus edwardii]|uniref:cell division cycle-associated protein 2 n=1 Tax=Elephantulus edwardii TaxID=28737 RepID=UPI0003F06EFE|nr:PREDICTED: cell division cycle-associated protein 2 [Elephantulus edwardii]
MDTDSKGKKPFETKEKGSIINNAENTPFIFGNGKLAAPQNHEVVVTPNQCRTDIFKSPSPLNFSTVTVEQLGITPESFVKSTPGESSSTLKKARRRSAIGARGSPETNHLICFISYCERLSYTHIVLFCIHVIKKEGLSERQQSGLSANLSSKRRRISYRSNSNEKLTDLEKRGLDLHLINTDPLLSTDRICTVDTLPADVSEMITSMNLEENSTTEELALRRKCRWEGIKTVDWVEDKQTREAISPKTWLEDRGTETENITTVPDIKSPVPSLCMMDIPSSETVVLRSVLKKPSSNLLTESLQEHCDNLCGGETHSSVMPNFRIHYQEQKAENHSAPTLLNVRKRKRVTFGEDLTPEVFDESLPANTPLRKGGTPVCKRDLGSPGPLQLEESPVPGPLSQPDFDDKEENLENIEPLQVSFAVPGSPSKSPIAETLSGVDTLGSSDTQEDVSSHNAGRITRTSNRRKQLTSFAEDSVCNLLNTEAQPFKEKKTNRRKSQEIKDTNKTLPKKKQVLKSGRKKKGKRKQDVKKSLYGEREVASKKPLLSPIPEIPETLEMTPSAPGIHRVYSDNFKSNGKPEEMLKPPENLTKRKTLLPEIPKDLCMDRSFDKHDVSEFCSSDKKSSSLCGNATFDQHSNVKIIEVNENEGIPKEVGEKKLISYTSVTEECIFSDSHKPDFILESQEFSVADQNVDNFRQACKISEDGNTKCDKEDGLLVLPEEKSKCCHLMPGRQKENVLIGSMKETKSQCEDLEGKCTENHDMTKKERKCRRRSMYSLDGQSLLLENSDIPNSASMVSSSVETDVEHSELCKDLSDAIEQTFKSSNETRVRRSTRLQKNLKNEGLVWISLPFPSTSCTSQKLKRRTISAVDSKGYENLFPQKETMSKRQTPAMLTSLIDKENGEDPATNPDKVLGKRRVSFCTSALPSTKNITQHPRGKSSLI